VPVLLAADWLLDRRIRRDDVVFRGFAGAQITTGAPVQFDVAYAN